MADLGISHAHADHYRALAGKKRTSAKHPVSAKHKAMLAVHAVILTAAFSFVAAMVLGIIG
ncbi:hypothetical protein [Oryzifoliimicrobium ureilyticus]|uniref:hypothetical protein n=1 Tax=Oryzifoliimicrobium ureilyticus TaxID=3113724 RepID=UPI0030760205